MSRVQKTTVYLREADYRRIKTIARELRRPPAALIRDAVTEFAGRYGRARRPESVGAGHSGIGDLSERAEELLSGIGRSR